MDSDVKMLTDAGTDVLFAPSVEEMYPAGISLDTKDQVGAFVEVRGLSHQL
jgi:pantoate--beta-alanine ligase